MEVLPIQKRPLIKETSSEKKCMTAEEIAETAFRRIKDDPTHKPASAISYIMRTDVKIEEKDPKKRTEITENLSKQSLEILKRKIKPTIVTPEMLREAKGREKSVPYDSR